MITFNKDGIFIDSAFYSINEVRENCYKARIVEEEWILVTIEWESTRGFSGIKEQFVIMKPKWNMLCDIIKKVEFYFHELDGKYSEVSGMITNENISISENINNIAEFLMENPSGHKYNESFVLNLYYKYFEYGVDMPEDLFGKLINDFVVI